MAREVNRLKGEDMTAAVRWRLICGRFLACWDCWAGAGCFPASGAQADDGEVAEIEALIQQRLDARKAKTGRRRTRRDRLAEMGIILEDGPQGTTAAGSAFTGRSICIERPVFYFFSHRAKINTPTPPDSNHTRVCPAVMSNKADDAVAAVLAHISLQQFCWLIVGENVRGEQFLRLIVQKCQH